MIAQRILLIAIACAASIAWMQRPGDSTSAPRVIVGPTEQIEIAEASLAYHARVDTGARTTSIHAESIRLVGDEVDFELATNDGRRIPMRLPVAKIRNVRNAQGVEERIFVELTLAHDGRAKPVLVNLRDRSHMTYPMLLGRNWLQDDYIVDVSLGDPTPPASG